MPNLSQAAEPVTRAFVLVFMDLISAPLRLCSRSTSIHWGGHEWIGAGQLASVESVADGGGEISGLSFTLTGVPQDDIALARAEQVRWQRVYLYMGALAEADDSIEWCEQMWTGVLDAMHIADAGDGTAAITVTAEHLGQTLKRPGVSRYTDAEQRRLTKANPDDSLKYIIDQAGRQIVWPERTWFIK